MLEELELLLIESLDAAVPCRVCGGMSLPKFSQLVLDRIEAHYYECLECQTLQVINPDWLNQVYVQDDAGISDLDLELVQRCLQLRHLILNCFQAGLFPGRRALDYGAGSALLVRLLRDIGLDAYGYEPYVNPLHARSFMVSDLAPPPYDLITMIEVVEHLVNPQEVLTQVSELLSPGGTILISTSRYDPERHDHTWAYLCPAIGQHITFYTDTAFKYLADKLGLSLRFLNGGLCLLTSRSSSEQYQSYLQQAVQTYTEQCQILDQMGLGYDYSYAGADEEQVRQNLFS